jgi:hypothetical protein
VLATNGLKLAEPDFYQKLKASSLNEIRLSYEESLLSSHPSKEHQKKIKFLDHLKQHPLDFNLVLAPTIFKGGNENLISETLDYAKDKPYIKRIELNGFSWVAPGITRDQQEMIMPEEMMDIVGKEFDPSAREDIYALQKILLMATRIFLNIHLCRLFQFILLIRKKGKFYLVTDYFRMSVLKKGLNFLLLRFPSQRTEQAISLALLIILGFKLKTFFLLKEILKNAFKKLFLKKTSDFVFLPLVVVTNCSTLVTDTETCSHFCSNGIIYKKDKLLKKGPAMMPFFTQ